MNKNNLDFFEETSAKQGVNIEEIFKKAINLLYFEYSKYLETSTSNNFNSESIYSSVNTKNSIRLGRVDVNKVKEKKECDFIKNKNKDGFCSC